MSSLCDCPQGVKEDFDWASYLLEGEDVPRHYVESPVRIYLCCKHYLYVILLEISP